MLLICEGSIRIDKKNQLLENRDERLERLKLLWKAERMKKLINSKANVDQDEILDNLKGSIDKLRRIRIKVDQKSLKMTGKRVFDEHNFIDLDTEYIEYEMLETYLNLPSHIRIKDTDSYNEDHIIKNIITR